VNGVFRPDLSRLPAGVEVSSLAGGRPDWTKALLGANDADHALAALSLALARDGALIRVPKDFAASRPVHLHFVKVANESAGRAAHVRNLIEVEKGARLSLLETHTAKGGKGDLTNQATDIVVRQNGILEHVKVIAEPSLNEHIATTFAEIEAGATYRPFILNASGALARNELVVRLTGRDGSFELSATTLAHGREHADITTLVEHAAPSSKSRQVVKSVIAGHGRGIYQGKILVREGANGTDSHQLSKSVLLSPTAEADTKPELEIYADDVKCGHGATAGALDENALFYLRSRGIPEKSATAMLLEAFIEDAVAAISNVEIRVAVSRVARSKLDRLGGEA
jgi:Fe-S cluster assembly protein SufD